MAWDCRLFLKRFANLANGIIFLAGPTGSGKSTTLAAIVEYVNMTRNCHVITIEDPIEYVYQNKKSVITQIQVGRDTHDFASAIRASLRQDPNVILLGEIRDLESTRLALIAAEAGHLVLTTLHASSASMAISRIIDVFPSDEKNRIRNMLAETVQAVVCQILVKRKTKGRTAVFEIMLGSPAIRHSIHQDMTAQMETIMQTNGNLGMCTMAQSLQVLTEQGVISPMMVRSVTDSRDAFKSLVLKNK